MFEHTIVSADHKAVAISYKDKGFKIVLDGFCNAEIADLNRVFVHISEIGLPGICGPGISFCLGTIVHNILEKELEDARKITAQISNKLNQSTITERSEGGQ